MQPDERLLQRLYRRRDAAAYVGASVYTFDRLVRPYLTTVPIGDQGVAFDRLELDAWVEHHKKANGRPPLKEFTTWGTFELSVQKRLKMPQPSM